MGQIHQMLGHDAFLNGWGSGLFLVDVADPVVDHPHEGSNAPVCIRWWETAADREWAVPGGDLPA